MPSPGPIQGSRGLLRPFFAPNTPITLYAATYRGVFKSTDAGATWSAANAGLRDTSVSAYPNTPRTLYAGGPDSGVFKSTDAGAT